MRIALLVLVLGCGGGSKKAAETPKEAPTCAAVADAMIALMLEGKEQTPKVKETTEGFTAIIRNRCDADAWSADAKQCLAGMTTRDDAERCSKLLTEEQQANLVRDEKAKYGAPPAEPEAAPPPPSPASTGAPMNDEKAKEAPKRSKGSPKPGDPCDGGE